MLKKRLFFGGGIVLLLLIILAAFGYHWYMEPHRSVASQDAASIITADRLFADYQSNEVSANQKYLGKVLEVKGRLAQIQHNGQSEVWILSGPTSTGGINCQLFAPIAGNQKIPQVGEIVTVKGKCTGYLMDVNLADCVVEH